MDPPDWGRSTPGLRAQPLERVERGGVATWSRSLRSSSMSARESRSSAQAQGLRSPDNFQEADAGCRTRFSPGSRRQREGLHRGDQNLGRRLSPYHTEGGRAGPSTQSSGGTCMGPAQPPVPSTGWPSVPQALQVHDPACCMPQAPLSTYWALGSVVCPHGSRCSRGSGGTQEGDLCSRTADAEYALSDSELGQTLT